MNQAEEDLLVIAAQGGSEKAFGLLFRLHHRSLLRFAFKICADRDVSQDAVQEAWIKSVANLRRLRDPRAFKSWLFRQVRWRVVDMLRKRRRLSEASAEEVEPDDLPAPEQNQDKESHRMLREAILRLPAVERQIIHLFYLDEMRLAEIAIVLEIPIGTVKSRLNRARKMLIMKIDFED